MVRRRDGLPPVTIIQNPFALIADTHGNGIALDLVLDDISAAGIQSIVCLGDVAAMGPHPAEVLRRVKELGCPVVMGNADAFALTPVADNDMDRRINDINAWCIDQLTAADLDFIRSFQPTVSVGLGGSRTLLCYHGSPRSFRDVITPATPNDDLDQLLDDGAVDLFAGGHTHVQMYRRHRTAIVLNPGSVGMAFDRDWPVDNARMAPWAEYAVVDPARLSVCLKRVPYRKEVVADAIKESGMPHATWLAAKWW
jgi:predicted phosphodiesterase